MLIKMAEHHNIIPKLVGISRKTTKNIQNYLQAVGMPKWSHFFSAFIGGEWGIGQIFGIPRDEDQSSGFRILKSALGNQLFAMAQDGLAEMIFFFIQTLGINRHILR